MAKQVKLTSIDELALMSAVQVLGIMPSGCMGTTHKQARAKINELLGTCPKGKPPKGTSTLKQCFAWLGLRTEADLDPGEQAVLNVLNAYCKATGTSVDAKEIQVGEFEAQGSGKWGAQLMGFLGTGSTDLQALENLCENICDSWA